VVGLVAGMGVTIAMVAIIKSAAGDSLGLDISVTFTPRSMVVAFCLGLIATFLVIFLSSWRASRLNIVSAIRDLPESKPVDPESATLIGYLRAVLNGILALALPLGASLFLLGSEGMVAGLALGSLGLVTPWFYHLRGTNVAAPEAHRTNEGAPRWPWILGMVIPVVGWVLILPWYFIALLLVRVVRDRKPATIRPWLPVAGIALPPIGFVVALLQDSRARISWSVGVGAALGLVGLVLTYAGLDRGSSFFFYLGVALICFWIAVTLRYFRIHERSTFTTISAFQLSLWYLGPAGKLSWLTGKLDGGIEMFFLSGLVMVACAVFIVVYNADIVLPLVARVGSRYGRIVPAIKTGVAYPLTSRFRTGMTMMMIGLIMFALVVQATLNSNFSQLFLNKDTTGGFDVQVLVNRNNRFDNIGQAVAQSGADAKAVRAAGELRIAYPFEAEVQNKDLKQRDGKVEEYSRYTLLGADDAFLKATTLPMKVRAAGYTSDRAIWDAMAADPTLAVLDASVTAVQQGFGGPPQGENPLVLDPVKEGFTPFTLKLRDPSTGTVTTITVIGQVKEAGDTFWQGIILRKETLLKTFPGSKGQAFYLSLNPGTDAKAYAKSLESGLVQVSADSLQKILNDRQKLQSGFLLVFQGFMGLGLIVGIAALGVVASRAVVERRQQIGMLRAIGYQRSMVALSFLFESGFIAVSGILIGLVLGLSLAWVLFTNGAVGNEGSSDVPFVVPWMRVGIVCAIAFVASMIMTYLPARSASHVAVAEALRYE
jgi:putative ABC transport system permease protein